MDYNILDEIKSLEDHLNNLKKFCKEASERLKICSKISKKKQKNKKKKQKKQKKMQENKK